MVGTPLPPQLTRTLQTNHDSVGECSLSNHQAPAESSNYPCGKEKKNVRNNTTKILAKRFYYADTNLGIELGFVSLEIPRATNLMCFTEMAITKIARELSGNVGPSPL